MSVKPFRVLLTNVTLASRTGTETALRDLVLGLKAAGHEPMVYSPALGEIADEISAEGIATFSRLQDVHVEPDIVHGNHHVETVAAVLQFRHARALFVCHDRRAHMSAPPRMGRIRSFVAVDYHCLERLTEQYGIPEHLTRVIYNSVDTRRFVRRPPLPRSPRRALIFSNYAGPGPYVDAVRDACARLNLSLDVIGSGVDNSSSAPEKILCQYDLVFAKARCALEAMAVGAAVVLADTSGLGPLVTSAEVAGLRRWNFGARLLRDPLNAEAIERQIRRYDADDAAAVSRYIRDRADVSGAVERYVHLYEELMNEPVAVAESSRELDEYLRHTTISMARMELELAEYRRPHRMEALSSDACAKLRLTIEQCPEHAMSGTTLDVRVEIDNRSVEEIGSFLPFPVQLSYRWFREGVDRPVVAEGLRTALQPPVPRRGKAAYWMKIAVPPVEPGRYRLRLTLVQEFVRWLDELPSFQSAEATIVVGSPPATRGTI